MANFTQPGGDTSQYNITYTLPRFPSRLCGFRLQQRNQPTEAPKVPEHAPFFLPTLPGIESRFVIEKNKEDKKSQKSTRRLEKAVGKSESVFYEKLVEASNTKDCEYFSDRGDENGYLIWFLS
jgi:hypothetical protein